MIIALSSNLMLFNLTFSGCNSNTWENNEKITGYDFTNPDKTLVLPDILLEISGLTVIDSVTIACVQDENGILFIYDLLKNKIKKQYTFNIDGDYEGITRIQNTIYILRSDGTLFEIFNFTTKDFKVNTYQTGIPAKNNEGLCYDADGNRLLIACKGKVAKGHAYKDKRVIHAFDLRTKKLSAEPIFNFDVSAIKTFIQKKNYPFPSRTKKKGEITEPIIKFLPSAIGIHPITKKLYLLSASDHCLFIFNMDGKIEHIEPLNPALFNKAEGITFFENGDLIITNEGQNKKPTLLRFNYRNF
ncbi:MAG: hypothetical protein A3F72_15195 [Bacteroidetes bacterium RIFCSPLOWO2_12_FULL_35_15]|nr:MAG: hypothetical protein A3F72_15195 [Bacteroidetes bacterium RIFCSPLOWO2_12_FULL_35_15]